MPMWYCRLCFSIGSLCLSGIWAIQDIGEITKATWGVDSIIRWLITLSSLLLAAYLAWANRTDAAKNRTIEVQKEELQILDNQNKRFKEELILKDKQILVLEGNIKALTARTDISQVLDRQQQLLIMKQEHDAALMDANHALMEALKQFQQSGAVQFREAMAVVSTIASQISEIHGKVVGPPPKLA